MTLHRPTNLMGIAAGHEAGERRASPIALDAKPLTAAQRTTIRNRRENEQKIARMRADPAVFVKEVMGGAVLQPWQKEVLGGLEAYAEMKKKFFADQGLPVIQERLERIHIGFDVARGKDHTAAVLVHYQPDGTTRLEPIPIEEVFAEHRDAAVKNIWPELKPCHWYY